MASFGKRAAELIKEVALLDPCSLPPYADALMSASKEEAMEHYRALLAALSALQARSEGGAAAAQPEDAAAVMVHNRALLRNKRLMLAYVCVVCTARSVSWLADARAATRGWRASRRCAGRSAAGCPRNWRRA